MPGQHTITRYRGNAMPKPRIRHHRLFNGQILAYASTRAGRLVWAKGDTLAVAVRLVLE